MKRKILMQKLQKRAYPAGYVIALMLVINPICADALKPVQSLNACKAGLDTALSEIRKERLCKAKQTRTLGKIGAGECIGPTRSGSYCDIVDSDGLSSASHVPVRYELGLLTKSNWSQVYRPATAGDGQFRTIAHAEGLMVQTRRNKLWRDGCVIKTGENSCPGYILSLDGLTVSWNTRHCTSWAYPIGFKVCTNWISLPVSEKLAWD